MNQAHSPTAPLAVPTPTKAGSLLVFADDWGRHPSSCQHLLSQLLPQYPTWWVNTIGMRAPRLDRKTIQRGWEKIGPWLRGRQHRNPLPQNLHVIDPKMWPWFSRSHDRWLNRRLMLRSLLPVVEQMPRPVVGISTLPIVGDLVSDLPCDRWVYYCVDDFSTWPGLDHAALARLENKLIARADRLIAASTTLQANLAAQGRDASLLTHGVDLQHWHSAAVAASGSQAPPQQPSDAPWDKLPRPLVVFWGLIDRRMDSEFIRQLARELTAGTILLVGPAEDPDPGLLAHPNVVHLPAMDYDRLPLLASAAEVLIMPYADLPVTRAMQPLKSKEYLATGKPVVARRLPAIEPWSDCLDAVETPAQFAAAVQQRLQVGLDPAQRQARTRLQHESWSAKASEFEAQMLLF